MSWTNRSRRWPCFHCCIAAWFGYALAQLNHTNYRAMTEEEILKPLGMAMSSAASTEAMRAHLAPGHLYTGEGRRTGHGGPRNREA